MAGRGVCFVWGALGPRGLQHSVLSQGLLECVGDSCATYLRSALSPPKAKSSEVRFSEAATSSCRVHFEDKLNDSLVMVTPMPDRSFLVKVGSGGAGQQCIEVEQAHKEKDVGFLKIQHKYEIMFTLPETPSLGREVCTTPLPNLHLRVTDITTLSQGGYRITCEYIAHQEGVLKEEVSLISETSENACVKVIVQARVLDWRHGTPMLLEGVRCIGAELEYDSEQSDWQGFD
ncbi:CT027 protein, partial [Polyodon spathula]|nr:CT027 protein [Polyodon spathula]